MAGIAAVADDAEVVLFEAGRSFDSVQRTLIIGKENLRRYVQGEKPLNVVDVERGYSPKNVSVDDLAVCR